MPFEIDYAGWQIAAILATYVIAAAVKGVTGLGFSTTCLPFLAFVVGLKDALALVIVPSVTSNLVVMYSAGRFGETLQRFWPMLLATLPGLGIGLWMLSSVDGTQAGAALGAILVLWCVFSLAKPSVMIPDGWIGPLAPVSGVLTGMVNGITGSQVFPMVPFLMMARLDRNLFVQAINCSFTMSSFVMVAGLLHLGLFTLDALVLSVLGCGLIVFGLRAGERVRAHLSPERFRVAVLMVLLAMGVSLLASLF
ncbi:sulfite exporter TauE/SafE family protein [Roseobacteraceae bacterium S113]